MHNKCSDSFNCVLKMDKLLVEHSPYDILGLCHRSREKYILTSFFRIRYGAQIELYELGVTDVPVCL